MTKSSQGPLFNDAWFSMALRSIGDAVIATDGSGRILFLNPVAEHLTGWREVEARGRDLPDVFRIVNERTRLPVENPVEKVLREGRPLALRTTPFSSPETGERLRLTTVRHLSRTNEGHIMGVVLVFRDVTEKRRAELLKERLAAIVESSDDVIVTKTSTASSRAGTRGPSRSSATPPRRSSASTSRCSCRRTSIEDTERILGRIRRGEKVDHYETKRRRKDGTIIDVVADRLPDPRRRGRDHRGLEGRPRHDREAGRASC